MTSRLKTRKRQKATLRVHTFQWTNVISKLDNYLPVVTTGIHGINACGSAVKHLQLVEGVVGSLAQRLQQVRPEVGVNHPQRTFADILKRTRG